MSSSPLSHSRLHGWLQLFRAPNLFTVPGDPLAGYLMANSGFVDYTLFLAILASLCFYSAGLLLNDVADEVEDRRDRPSRPLPSGLVDRKKVQVVTICLCLLGLLALAVTGSASAVLAGLALVAAIAAYNLATKRWPVVGAINMGACRGLSVLLGAAVGPLAIRGMAVFPFLAVTLYIAAVTALARHETQARAPLLPRLLPLLAMAGAAVVGAIWGSYAPATRPAAILFLVAGGASLWVTIASFSEGRPPLPALIGRYIRALLPLQAAFALLGDPWRWGPAAAAGLLVVWPVSRVVSRRFYAS